MHEQGDDRPEGTVERAGPTRWMSVCLGLLVLGVAAIVAARWSGEHAQYVIWTDRDLFRAAVPWRELPTSGAELSYAGGGRVPGGAVYVLIKLAQSVWDHPLAVARWITLLGAVALGLLYAAGRRFCSRWASGLVVVVYLTSMAVSDNLERIWNPAFLSLFVAGGWACWAWSIHRRDARGLVGVVFCMLVAAQLHLSGLLVGVAMVLWASMTGLRRWRPAALGMVAVALCVYGPYLVGEWQQGWPNTRLLVGKDQLPSMGEGVGGGSRVEALRHGVRLFLPPRLVWPLGAHGPAGFDGVAILASWLSVLLGWGTLVAGLGLTLGRGLPRTPRQWALLGTLVVPVVTLIWFLLDPRVDFSGSGAGRYLHAVVPGAALGVGLAVDGVHARLRPTRPRLAMGLVTAVTLVGLLQVAASLGRLNYTAHVGRSVDLVQDTLDLVARDTGRSVAEVVGSTFWAEATGDGWVWEIADGVDDVVRRAGGVVDGPVAPPCTLVLRFGAYGREAAWPSPDDIAGILGQTLPGVEVLDRIDHGLDRHVHYTTDQAVCLTTFSNRYLPRDEELALRPFLRTLAPGDVVALDHRGARVVSLPRPEGRPSGSVPTLVGVSLVEGPLGVTARLWGNHLRGFSFNDGFFHNALIGRPRLVLRDEAGASHTLDWGVNLVGVVGAITPLVVQDVVPSGVWQVSLALDVYNRRAGYEPGVMFDTLPATPVEVDLAMSWTVP